MRRVVVGVGVCAIVASSALVVKRQDDQLRARVLEAEEQFRQAERQLYGDAGPPSLDASRLGDYPPWYGGEPKPPSEKSGPQRPCNCAPGDPLCSCL